MEVVQSVMIPKHSASLDEAVAYAFSHFKVKKLEFPQASEYYRFRLYQPRYLRECKKLDKIKWRIDPATGIYKVIFYSSESS